VELAAVKGEASPATHEKRVGNLGEAVDDSEHEDHLGDTEHGGQRPIGIIEQALGTPRESAERALAAAGEHVPTAMVMLKANVSAEEAKERLIRAKGNVREAMAGIG